MIGILAASSVEAVIQLRAVFYLRILILTTVVTAVQINITHISTTAKVENLILLARIMKDRLTTNSTNSSKPPSKDDLKDKGSQEEETTEGKNKPKPTRKAGGQKGHAGSQLSLLENPDEII